MKRSQISHSVSALAQAITSVLRLRRQMANNFIEILHASGVPGVLFTIKHLLWLLWCLQKLQSYCCSRPYLYHLCKYLRVFSRVIVVSWACKSTMTGKLTNGVYSTFCCLKGIAYSGNVQTRSWSSCLVERGHIYIFTHFHCYIDVSVDIGRHLCELTKFTNLKQLCLVCLHSTAGFCILCHCAGCCLSLCICMQQVSKQELARSLPSTDDPEVGRPSHVQITL